MLEDNPKLITTYNTESSINIFHQAAYYSGNQMLRFLITKRLSFISDKDNAGKTILDCARENKASQEMAHSLDGYLFQPVANTSNTLENMEWIGESNIHEDNVAIST